MTRSTPLLRNLIPLAYTLLRLLGDALHFLSYACAQALHLPRRISFCVSNWPCIRNATFNRDEPPIGDPAQRPQSPPMRSDSYGVWQHL
jgi:hypothetical protein